jgi:cyclophilin family peptidyl-prolyl cis-trans isomerase
VKRPLVVLAFAATLVAGIAACSSSSDAPDVAEVVTDSVPSSEAASGGSDGSVDPLDPVDKPGETTVVATGPGQEPTERPIDQVAFGTAPCVQFDEAAPPQRVFAAAPQRCVDQTKTYTAVMVTNKGTMTFELDVKRAPLTVNSFVNLARAKYFDGIHFHRVVPNFVLQAGDPTVLTPEAVASPSAGTGGPGYEFANENPNGGEYQIGSLAMANAGPDTNGSQFFVISGENGKTLPPQYSLFGGFTGDPASLETMNAIAGLAVTDGPPSEPVVIQSVRITEQ